ncbi:MAG: tetratricopeptide repeat protein [Gammaproteobacteria bacterium]|nr:tetratricopeptide repeat protein [Gammaproteobacteria bacterium]
MKKTFKNLVLTSSLLFSTTIFAGQENIDQIEQAAGSLNINQLMEIKDSLQGYDRALAHYRLALSANLTEQTKLAKQSINLAIELLEELNEQDQNNTELLALLAQSYGYKIALEPIKGVYYGPKSAATLAKAEELDPNNPRVLLVKGIAALNTPAMFGGNMETAYESFNKAIDAYPQDTHSDFHWGHAEAYTWRGLIHMKNGHSELAKSDWQTALTLNPDYGWAKSMLNIN